TYRQAIELARTATHRHEARKGYVKALTEGGREEEAQRFVEEYMQDVGGGPAQAAAMVTKIRVLLAKDDLTGAQKLAARIDRMPKAYQYHKDWGHILVADYQQDRAKKLAQEGKHAEALRIDDELIRDSKTPQANYNRAVTEKLALMPKVMEPRARVGACDKLLADARSKTLAHCILFSKVEAQFEAGNRKGARETAAILLAHPELYGLQKEKLTKLFGGNLPEPAFPKRDDPQVAQQLEQYENVLGQHAPPDEMATAAREMLSLLNRSGRPQEAIQRAEELLVAVTEPYVRQCVYRGLYDARTKAGDLTGAAETAQAMLRQVRAPRPYNPSAMRELTFQVFTDFAKQCRQRGRTDLARPLVDGLARFMSERDLTDADRNWAAATSFAAYRCLGDMRGALKFFRRGVNEFAKPPADLETVIQMAAGLADKTELPPDRQITMGESDASGLLADVAFAARWYFKNNPKGPTSSYAEPLHHAVDRMYTRSGKLLELARLIEEVVKDAPANHDISAGRKYRAAEIYLTVSKLGEARRALTELQRQWPSWHERAELLLADVDAKEDVKAAIKRLQQLHATAKNSRVWFASGERLYKLCEEQKQWEEALAVQKEMGKRDHRRLLKWAYWKEQQAKRPADAFALFSQHRQQKPNDHESYMGQARCLTKLERFEDALEICDVGCRHFPPGEKRRLLLLQSGWLCLRQLKRYQEAEKRFRGLLTAYPDTTETPSAEEGLIRSLNRLGKHAEALALCKVFLSAHSDHARALAIRQQLALAYVGLGKVKEAIELLEQAIAKHKLDRGNLPPEMLLTLARVHLASGDKAKAAAFAKEVIEKHSKDEDAKDTVEETRKVLEKTK
ncbi:MAG: hypothetical protein AMS16_00155, partial [Planctomycetes bacterium DG_58]